MQAAELICRGWKRPISERHAQMCRVAPGSHLGLDGGQAWWLPEAAGRQRLSGEDEEWHQHSRRLQVTPASIDLDTSRSCLIHAACLSLIVLLWCRPLMCSCKACSGTRVMFAQKSKTTGYDNVTLSDIEIYLYGYFLRHKYRDAIAQIKRRYV